MRLSLGAASELGLAGLQTHDIQVKHFVLLYSQRPSNPDGLPYRFVLRQRGTFRSRNQLLALPLAAPVLREATSQRHLKHRETPPLHGRPFGSGGSILTAPMNTLIGAEICWA